MPLTPQQLGHIVHALSVVLPLRAPADVVLRHFFRDRPALGARDRAVVAETVYAVLRRRRLLETLTPEATPRQLALAALVKLAGHSLREIQPLLQDGEEQWLAQVKACDVNALPDAVQADLPDWVMARLEATMPREALLQLARGLQQPAPLDLRVNTLLARRDEVLEALAKDGIAAQPTPFSPIGVRLKDKPAINRHPLFLTGKVEVQDEGSQLLGFLVEPRRHELVVDFCAGAGGKALLLGQLMHSQGRVYAFDVSEKRLDNLKPRLKRSGLSNLHPVRIAGENDPRVKRLRGKIDRVLVDAPCSGLGTLRRNPDLKWRQTPEGLEEIEGKQQAILHAAAALLKPGGRLVYATCSILEEENQEAVERFLGEHPDFRPLDCGEIFARQKIPLECGQTLRLFPHVHGTDGFFAVAMERSR